MTNNDPRLANRIHLLNTELRHIDASKLTKLSVILDTSRDWSKLIDGLTRPEYAQLIGTRPVNLTIDAINLIGQQVNCGKSPSSALLNYWSITGRKRPTVLVLIKYLYLCNLKRAEEYVCQEILGVESIQKLFPPKVTGDASAHQRDPNSCNIDEQYKFSNLKELVENLNPICKRFSFESIRESTNGFCPRPFDPVTSVGTKIGEGRFSSVFRAKVDIDGHEHMTVAAKLLKSECTNKYLANELDLTVKIRHDNVLELLGVALGQSSSGSLNYICLIYPYMQNGSLLNCLGLGLPTRTMDHLKWYERIQVATKIARGIAYLHSFHEGPIIHRDIKSANVFIDEDLKPKIGDFTLVRQLDSSRQNETQFSQNVIGTSVYMPPEAFRGDISLKFDCFSFGIVLLELITGMRPFSEEHDEDLFTYINDSLSDIDDECNLLRENSGQTLEDARVNFLTKILDKKAGNWDLNISKIVFNLALKATENRKKDRPDILSIVESLESVLSQTNNLIALA